MYNIALLLLSIATLPCLSMEEQSYDFDLFTNKELLPSSISQDYAFNAPRLPLPSKASDILKYPSTKSGCINSPVKKDEKLIERRTQQLDLQKKEELEKSRKELMRKATLEAHCRQSNQKRKKQCSPSNVQCIHSNLTHFHAKAEKQLAKEYYAKNKDNLKKLLREQCIKERQTSTKGSITIGSQTIEWVYKKQFNALEFGIPTGHTTQH